MKRNNTVFTPSPYPSPQGEGTNGNPTASGWGIKNIIKNKHIDVESRIVYAGENEVADINDILTYIGVLIIDYSGVYFEYLFLK